MTDLEHELRTVLMRRAEDVTSDPDRVRRNPTQPGSTAAVRWRPNDRPDLRLGYSLSQRASCSLQLLASASHCAVRTTTRPTSAATVLPIAPRGVVGLEVDQTDLRPLAELSADDVVLPTAMVRGLTVQPTALYDGQRATTRAESDDESAWMDVSQRPGSVSLQSAASTERLEAGGLTWTIDETGSLTSAVVEVNGVGILVTSENVSRDDVAAVLERLRIGPPDAAPAGSFDVDAADNIVYSSGEFRLNYGAVGQWSCWSLFERTRLQATLGSCVRLDPQPDGTVVFATPAISLTDGEPTEQFGNIVSTTRYVIGTVPSDAVAVEVRYPGTAQSRHQVGDVDDATGARFFVAVTEFDSDQHLLVPTVTAVFIATPATTGP